MEGEGEGGVVVGEVVFVAGVVVEVAEVGDPLAHGPEKSKALYFILTRPL